MPNYDDERVSEFQSALAAGSALGAPQVPAEKGLPYAVIPEGYKLESLEDLLPVPRRISQNVVLHDADSFIAYVNEFGCIPTTHIFFSVETEEFEAVIDYHTPERDGTDSPLLCAQTPGWCDHTAKFKPRRSPEFTTWMNQNRKAMKQVDFARFLEDNIPDVVEPPSAELLSIALTFEAKKSVEFSSGVRLNNGQIQFQYDEIVRGTAQKGTMEIPESFTLGIPIHVNGPAYRIPVRLRWRLAEGKVEFWYEIVRPHRFVEDALKEIRERMSTETEIPVLAGASGLK